MCRSRSRSGGDQNGVGGHRLAWVTVGKWLWLVGWAKTLPQPPPNDDAEADAALLIYRSYVHRNWVIAVSLRDCSS